MSRNLYDRFRQTAQAQPEQAAVLGPQAAGLSYRALDEAICAASDRLRAAGLRPGDCVGLHHPSSTSYIVYTYAVWRAGGCIVPFPMELVADEKQDMCRCLALDHVISNQRGSSFLSEFLCGEPAELGDRDALYPVRGPAMRPAGLDAIDAAFIRFSSGTTGAAKGVVLSHETIFERICAANEVLAIGPHDRVLWVLSMAYHFTVSIVGYLTFGATIVLPANHFAAAILDAVKRHSATLLYASPMHYALLADFPGAAPQGSLRLTISTTSSLDMRVAEQFHQRYGRPIGQALGIIEVGLPCINVDGGPEHWRSVGRVLPAYRLRLEDVGLGADMQEVALSGPGFLDAYYHPWQVRRDIMAEGWFHTGDVGRIGADGYLYLNGRTKDVINVMGMKFFPQEVERVLASHPAVAAATVFAGRDERRGETVRARVVPRSDWPGTDLATQLQQHCREHVASYKVPEQIEFVADLPRTASGKVLHRAVG